MRWKIAMFKESVIVAVIFTIFLTVSFATFGPILFTSSFNDKSSTADGFNIDAYDVVLDVASNNVVNVTENITVNWYEEFHHGIYKITPQWLEYTPKDGKTIKRKSVIRNYRAENDEYVVENSSGKKRIRIGDASSYVPLGKKTYTIKYEYDMGKDPYRQFDEFIFHAFGDYWGTSINNATIQINMPKDITGSNINFFLDKYRDQNANAFVDYQIIGNSLTAHFNQDKYRQYQQENYCQNNLENGVCNLNHFNEEALNEALTLDIELPEGYFTGGSYNYGYVSLVTSILIILLTIYNFFNWYRYGKNYPKVAATVEFYPPDNLSAAEIGYIYNRQSSKKLTVSLIIELASKGFLKIDTQDKKKIKITNLAPEVMEKLLNKTRNKDLYYLKKLKDIDDNLSKEAKTMMKYLFKDSDERRLMRNIKKFEQCKDELLNNGYIEFLNPVKETKKLPELNKYEEIVFKRLFKDKDEIILSDHPTFYRAFSEIENKLESEYKYLIYDEKAINKAQKSFIVILLNIVFSLISFFIIEDMDPNFSFLYYLTFICIPINLLLSFIMQRTTKKGEQLNAQIRGFRNFLVTAEKEKLETLVNENPQYFYNILPYTYVLNVSRKWIKKFENIKMPELDMGSYNLIDTNSYHNFYDDVYVPKSTYSSGGSSSSSGGCSSCGGGGGGCSSCGGGGSW